jgi:putative membrane protein
MITLDSIRWFLMYFATGVAMLWVFTRLYKYITPYNEDTQIAEGKMAPAIAYVGAMIGFTIPIVTMSYHGALFTEYLIWSGVAGVIQLICFRVLYWKMPTCIQANNCAGALLFLGAAVCTGIINAFSLIP